MDKELGWIKTREDNMDKESKWLVRVDKNMFSRLYTLCINRHLDRLYL